MKKKIKKMNNCYNKIFFVISILFPVMYGCHRNSNVVVADKSKTVMKWHDSLAVIPSKVFIHEVDINNFNDGVYVTYRKDGSIINKIELKHGIKDGKVKSYYESGELFFVINYEKGIKEGITKTYSRNGVLLCKGRYCGGKKCGEWIYFDKNGENRKTKQYYCNN